MSRSRYKVAKCPICYGSNTPYYKMARRHLRSLNKRTMRDLLSRHRGDWGEIDDRIVSFDNRHDTEYDDWNEPTDGSTYIWKQPLPHDQEALKMWSTHTRK